MRHDHSGRRRLLCLTPNAPDLNPPICREQFDCVANRVDVTFEKFGKRGLADYDSVMVSDAGYQQMHKACGSRAFGDQIRPCLMSFPLSLNPHGRVCFLDR